MVADSFIKSQMHRMPTYEEVLNDAMFSKDRINLPDRRATQLRNSHQLTRFDEVDETPDLQEEQVKITKEKLKNIALAGMGGGPGSSGDAGGTVALNRAKMEADRRGPQDPDPDSEEAPRFSVIDHYTRQKQTGPYSEYAQARVLKDQRNFLQRGADYLFKPRKEPYKIRWNPMFDRIQEARQDLNEINMARARYKGGKAAEAERKRQIAEDAQFDLEASSSSMLPWNWAPALPTPQPPQEMSIATPPRARSPASSGRGKKASSEPGVSGPSMWPAVANTLTNDNPLRRFMLAGNQLGF